MHGPGTLFSGVSCAYRRDVGRDRAGRVGDPPLLDLPEPDFDDTPGPPRARTTWRSPSSKTPSAFEMVSDVPVGSLCSGGPRLRADLRLCASRTPGLSSTRSTRRFRRGRRSTSRRTRSRSRRGYKSEAAITRWSFLRTTAAGARAADLVQRRADPSIRARSRSTTSPSARAGTSRCCCRVKARTSCSPPDIRGTPGLTALERVVASNPVTRWQRQRRCSGTAAGATSWSSSSR